MKEDKAIQCPICHKAVDSADFINQHIDSGCSVYVSSPRALAGDGRAGRDQKRSVQSTMFGGAASSTEFSLARQSSIATYRSPPPKQRIGTSSVADVTGAPSSSHLLMKTSLDRRAANASMIGVKRTAQDLTLENGPEKRREGEYGTPSPPSASSSHSHVPTPVGMSPQIPHKPQGSPKGHVPLADLVRPKDLESFCGHTELVGEKSLLRSLVEQRRLPSMIVWGTPGCGKTTLARIIAKSQQTYYREFSAVMHSINDIKKVVEEAKNHQRLTGRKPILFIDEVHRFNKAQQDFFLPGIERGEYTFVGATTENPSFRINSALLSRCQVFVLSKLQPPELLALLRRALNVYNDTYNGPNTGCPRLIVKDNHLEKISSLCDGDARSAINMLELVLESGRAARGRRKEGERKEEDAEEVDEATVLQALQKTHLLYDQAGEEHYNIISALHKSMRGSDPDASLYWLGRMLYAGEDPLYVARRLVRFASEDIGMADSRALPLAVSAYQACHFIGMPECDVILGHCAVYLARAPKSVEIYRAMKKVKQTIETGTAYPVPLHLRNAPTALMAQAGYGKGYKYNPDYKPEELADQEYLPMEMRGWKCFD